MTMQTLTSVAILTAVFLSCCKDAVSYRAYPAASFSWRILQKSASNSLLQQRKVLPNTVLMLSDDVEAANVESVVTEEEKAKKPSIFVGNLPFALDEDSIRSLLTDRMGEELDVNLITDKNTGRHRGFGYIEFESEDEASAAIEKLSGMQVEGRDVRVDMAMDRSMRPPRQPRYNQENSIFIGNLDFSVTEEQVMAMCNDILGDGVAVNVRLVTDRETGRPRGFGHVDFNNPEDATRAVTELAGVSMLGRDLRVDHARRRDELPPRTPRFSSHSIFIGNLAWDVDSDLIEEMLNDMLGEGQYTKVRLALDRETGRSRGFCHVDFASGEAADRAIVELNGLEVMGRVLRVDTAQRKSGGPRRDSGGDFRGTEETGSFGAF